MAENSSYFVLREKAVPEVLLKVVEAKRLIDSGKAESVQDATEAVGISRSSFYKYKDDIFPYHENAKGKTITMVIQLDDEPGILSVVLKTIAEFRANILTIHQSVPVNGIASLTLSIDVFPETGSPYSLTGTAMVAGRELDPEIVEVYDFIMAGSEAAGAASGIMNAADPIAMIDEMIAATRRAADDLKKMEG